jgi:hypothetical protein
MSFRGVAPSPVSPSLRRDTYTTGIAPYNFQLHSHGGSVKMRPSNTSPGDGQ